MRFPLSTGSFVGGSGRENPIRQRWSAVLDALSFKESFVISPERAHASKGPDAGEVTIVID